MATARHRTLAAAVAVSLRSRKYTTRHRAVLLYVKFDAIHSCISVKVVLQSRIDREDLLGAFETN